MKKGFTLIEILAVITLIGVLSVIGSISVTKLIKSSKEKTYQEQVNNVEISAKTWATNNTALLSVTKDFKTYVSVEELKQAGLLENKDIIDPRNDKKMNGCVEITYSDKTKKYKYQYSNNCGNKADYPNIDIVYNANDKNYIEVTQDAQDKKKEIINNINVNAFDKNGNVIEISGPIITKNGKTVEEIIPNKVGDEYILTYVASQNNFKTTKALKLKVVDTTPPEIYIGSTNVTGRIVNNNIIVGSEFKEPELTVEDNSGERIKAVRSGKINTQSAGEYELVYTAIDSSKNKSTYIVDVIVRLPNQLSFSLKASEVDGNNGWYKSNPTVSIEDLKYGSGSDSQTAEEATCKYRINTGSTINLGRTRAFSVSTEGSSVKVKVDCSYTNENNKTATDSQTIILKIDKTNPTCTTSGGSSSWTNSNVTIKGTCSDSLSRCTGINPNYTITVPDETIVEKTNIGPGDNGEVATVYDKAGNKGTCSANQTVKIDKIAPTCTVTAKNADGSTHSGWTNQNVTVKGTCSDNGGSGCTSRSPSKTYSKETDSEMYPGSSKLAAYVEDNAGNKTSCGTISVQIDKTDPYSPYVLDQDPRNYNVISSNCTCRPTYLYGEKMAQTCKSDINSLFGLLSGGNHCVVNVKSNSNWKFWIYSKDSGGSGPAYVEYTTGNLGKGTYCRREFGEPIMDGSWFSSTIYMRTYDKAGNVSPLMELTTNR